MFCRVVGPSFAQPQGSDCEGGRTQEVDHAYPKQLLGRCRAEGTMTPGVGKRRLRQGTTGAGSGQGRVFPGLRRGKDHVSLSILDTQVPLNARDELRKVGESGLVIVQSRGGKEGRYRWFPRGFLGFMVAMAGITEKPSTGV